MNVFKLMFVALVVISVASVDASEESVSKLIQEAHKHDNMYTLGPSASQQEALKNYQSALGAEPDDKQRLHILYRMGQLYGSCYQLEKGEKPDFRKAIELYKQIIDSYHPEEPLVYKSMISIGDHYTSLWEFEKALEWHKKGLEYDTGVMAEELNTLKKKEIPRFEFTPDGPRSERLTKEQLLELRKDHKRAKLLEKSLKEIRRYQEVAVDQVAYSASFIDPFRAHGELRVIIEQHRGTFIAERAVKRFKENMDRLPELWAPQDDDSMPFNNSSIQANTSSPSALTESYKAVNVNSDNRQQVTRHGSAIDPNTVEKSQRDKHAANEPRAPPVSYLLKLSITVAGLLFVVVAAVLIRNKVTSL